MSIVQRCLINMLVLFGEVLVDLLLQVKKQLVEATQLN